MPRLTARRSPSPPAPPTSPSPRPRRTSTSATCCSAPHRSRSRHAVLAMERDGILSSCAVTDASSALVPVMTQALDLLIAPAPPCPPRRSSLVGLIVDNPGSFLSAGRQLPRRLHRRARQPGRHHGRRRAVPPSDGRNVHRAARTPHSPSAGSSSRASSKASSRSADCPATSRSGSARCCRRRRRSTSSATPATTSTRAPSATEGPRPAVSAFLDPPR